MPGGPLLKFRDFLRASIRYEALNREMRLLCFIKQLLIKTNLSMFLEFNGCYTMKVKKNTILQRSSRYP